MKEVKDKYGYTFFILEKSDLEKLPTQVLIRMVHKTTRTPHPNDIPNKGRYGENNEYVLNKMESWWTEVFKESELREVLKTRPHIPNKKEAKAIRQQKAKERYEKRYNRRIRK